MGGESRGEVSTGRSTGDSDFIWVDTKLVGIFAQDAHCLLCVCERYGVVAVGEAIFEDGVSDALGIKPVGHIMAFVGYGLVSISATGTHEDSLACRIFRCIDGDGGVDFKVLGFDAI